MQNFFLFGHWSRERSIIVYIKKLSFLSRKRCQYRFVLKPTCKSPRRDEVVVAMADYDWLEKFNWPNLRWKRSEEEDAENGFFFPYTVKEMQKEVNRVKFTVRLS